MKEIEADPQEAEVAQMAVRALSDAQRHARASGRPVVVVVDGELVRVGPAGRTVIKRLAPRRRVLVRSKQATT